MLLILGTEYNSHQSVLNSITANHNQVLINSDNWVYCEVTNQTAFNQYASNLNSDYYADGILLPPGSMGR